MKRLGLRKFTGPIPDPTGTARTGKHEELPTRRALENDLISFISSCSPNSKQPGPQGMILLGEWGDGKTELFDAIIQPSAPKNGDRSIYVSGTTVLSAYQLSEAKKWVEKTSLEAEKFVISLLFALRDHGPVKGVKFPDPPTNVKRARDLISEWLDLVFYDFQGSMIIFLDEFEEFLPHDKGLRRTIMGIRSLLSKDLVLGKNNEYINRLHLIIACTPAAYYRLQTKKVVEEIIGGFQSRLQVNEMGRIPEIESINFLFSLLLQAWNNEIPDIPPISSPGVLATLARVSQGNIRYMTSFLGQLLQKQAKIDEFFQINGMTVIDFLRTRQLSIYGGETPAIDQEFYRRFFEAIEDLYEESERKIARNLVTILLGELEPIGINELIARGIFSDTDSAIRLINRLGIALSKRLGVNRSFLRFVDAKKGLSIDEIFEVGFGILGGRVETYGSEKFFILGIFEESIEVIKEKLSVYSFDKENKSIKRIPLIPRSRDDWKSLFPDLNSSQIADLDTKFKKDFIREDYKELIGITKEIELRLFAPPVPPGLEYITNRQNRFLLWREVNSRSTEIIADYLPKKILEYLEIISSTDQTMSIKFKAMSSLNGLFEFGINLTPDSKDFKGISILNTHRLTSGEAQELTKKLKDRYKYKIVLIFLTDSITDNAREILELKNRQEFPNRFLLIEMSATLTRKILAAVLAHEKAEKGEIEIDEELWFSNVKKLLFIELGMETRLTHWIESQKNNGVIIPIFNLENPTSLANAFGFLAKGYSLSQSTCTIEGAWKTVREDWKDGYSDFGPGGTSLSPADETAQYVEKHFPYLIAGKFVSTDLEEFDLHTRYRLRLNAVHNRIILLISESPQKMDELSNKFIEETSIQNLLKAYVESLRTLGLISPTIDNKLTAKTKLETVVLSERTIEIKDRLEQLKKEYNQLSISLNRRILTTMKQREYKMIYIGEFLERIERYFRQILEQPEERKIEYQINQKSLGVSCVNVMVIIAENWLKKLRKIQHEIKKQKEDVKEKRVQLRSQVKQLLKSLENKSIVIENIDDIFEIEEMEEIWKQFEFFFEDDFEKQSLEKEMERVHNSFAKKKKDSEEKRLYFYNQTPTDPLAKNLARWSFATFFLPLRRKLELAFDAVQNGLDSIALISDDTETKTSDPLTELSQFPGHEGKPSSTIEEYLRNFFQTPASKNPLSSKEMKFSLESIKNLLDTEKKRRITQARAQTIKIQTLSQIINVETNADKSLDSVILITKKGMDLFDWDDIQIKPPKWKKISDDYINSMSNVDSDEEHNTFKTSTTKVLEELSGIINGYDTTTGRLESRWEEDTKGFLEKFSNLICEAQDIDCRETTDLKNLLNELKEDLFKFNADFSSQLLSYAEPVLASIISHDQDIFLSSWQITNENMTRLMKFFEDIFGPDFTFPGITIEKVQRDKAFNLIEAYNLDNITIKRREFNEILTEVNNFYNSQLELVEELWKETILSMRRKATALNIILTLIGKEAISFPILEVNLDKKFQINQKISPIMEIKKELLQNEKTIRKIASELGLGGKKVSFLLELSLAEEKIEIQPSDIDIDLKDLAEKGYVTIFATLPLNDNNLDN